MRVFFRIIIPSVLLLVFLVLIFSGKINWEATDYLSFGMIVLTYFYVVFTWEMLNRIETQNYLEKRPYLIGDFHKDRQVVKFYVRNIGKTPATNVKIQILPDVVTFQGKSLNETLFKKPIKFFAPDQKIDTAINTKKDFFEKEKNRNYKVKFDYRDKIGNSGSFIETIDLNLDHLEEENNLLYKTTTDLVNSIDKLAKEIRGN